MSPTQVTYGILAFIAATVAVALLTPGDSFVGLHSGTWPVFVVFFTVIVIGEQFRLHMPGRLPTSPMATAGGIAFAITTRLPDGPVVCSSTEVVLTVATAQAIGGLVHQRRTGIRDSADALLDAAVRLFSVALAAVLVRETPLPWADGRALDEASIGWPGWALALALLGVGTCTGLIEAPLRSARRSASERTSWRQAAADEAYSSLTIGVAIATTGTLVALTASVLGLVAIPLVLMFLGLTEFAVRRFVHVRETYRQSLRALGVMPEVVGYIADGHAARVSDLCRLIGREMRMSEREIDRVATAALLHDIGQMALRRPLPRGATVQAAPSDQQRIAENGANLVREAAPPEPLHDLLALQAVPYHRIMSGREDVPLAARVIKVANAFDDYGGILATGAPDAPEGAQAALERIYLGLGYEYDPRVVEALARVLERDAAPGPTTPALKPPSSALAT